MFGHRVVDYRTIRHGRRQSSLALDGERFHRLVDRLSQLVPELAPQLMTLSRREQEPVRGTLRQGRRDHFEVGADHSGEVFKRVGKFQGCVMCCHEYESTFKNPPWPRVRREVESFP